MGMTKEKIRLQNIETKQELELELLIDTGALYTAISETDWNRLGLRADKMIKVRTASNENLQVPKTGIKFYWQESVGTADVIALKSISHALLGVTALEAMNLTVDPSREKLVAKEVALLL